MAPRYVPYLADLVDAKEAELPHIYLIDPIDHTVVPYPEKLDTPENFNPEVVLAWARLARVETSITRIEELKAKHDSAAEQGEPEDEEEKKEFNDAKEYISETIS